MFPMFHLHMLWAAGVGFTAVLKEKHGGSLIRAWKESLDTDKSGRLGKDELVSGESARACSYYSS